MKFLKWRFSDFFLVVGGFLEAFAVFFFPNHDKPPRLEIIARRRLGAELQNGFDVFVRHRVRLEMKRRSAIKQRLCQRFHWFAVGTTLRKPGLSVNMVFIF